MAAVLRGSRTLWGRSIKHVDFTLGKEFKNITKICLPSMLRTCLMTIPVYDTKGTAVCKINVEQKLISIGYCGSLTSTSVSLLKWLAS